jgi:hypothetical protein
MLGFHSGIATEILPRKRKERRESTTIWPADGARIFICRRTFFQCGMQPFPLLTILFAVTGSGGNFPDMPNPLVLSVLS